MVLATVQFVDDIESSRLFLHVKYRGAALLRRRVRVLLLRILLNFIAGIAACARTGHGCQSLAASATNLMPQDAANQGADSGTYQAVLILDGLRVGDLFIVALLSRNLDRSRQRLGAQHLGCMSRLIHVVASRGTSGDNYDGASKRPRHECHS